MATKRVARVKPDGTTVTQYVCTSCGQLVETDGAAYKSAESAGGGYAGDTNVDRCPSLQVGQTHRPL